jgi:hypothetical protein
MSDYLWDKTGEADEEVERLEELLGTLRYKARPLQLPESLRVPAARRKFRPQRQFTWQRLAVAASLLLMLLAGTWLIRSLHSNELRREAAQKPNVIAPSTNEQPKPDETANAHPNDKPAPQPNMTPAVVVPVKYHRQRTPVHAGMLARHSPSPVPPAQKNAALHNEQIAHVNPAHDPTPEEAARELLQALRITSAKLNYAERQVQEMSAARKPALR